MPTGSIITQTVGRDDPTWSAPTAGKSEVMDVTSESQKQDQLSPLPSDSAKPISIAIDPVALITTECITVTSAMRKHTRWAQSSVSAILGGGTSFAKERESNAPFREEEKLPSTSPTIQRTRLASDNSEGLDGYLASRWGLRGKKGKSMQDNPLISAFARLRHDLRGCQGW